MDTSISQKQCRDCKDFFPVTKDSFYPSVVNKDGWMTQCISCRSKYMSARYARQHPKPEKPVPPEGHRFCIKCDQPKRLNEKNFRTMPKDGFYNVCRECMNKQDTERVNKRQEKSPPVFSEEVLKKCSTCPGEFPATPLYFYTLTGTKGNQMGLISSARNAKRKEERSIGWIIMKQRSGAPLCTKREIERLFVGREGFTREHTVLSRMLGEEKEALKLSSTVAFILHKMF